MTNKKRTANSAQAQPKKGMRLFANRYGQGYETPQLKRKDKRTTIGKTFGHFDNTKL